MNDGSIVKQYSSGAVKKFVTDAGYEFEAYIPDNCTADTNIIIYEHGNDGYYSDWKTYDAKFETDGCDSIVIRADRCDSMSLYNYIVDEYNLSEESRMTVSFSGGTVYALKETAQMIKQNPEASSPVAVILDGYVPTGYLVGNGFVDTLKEGNALVLAFAQLNSNNGYVEQYMALAETGVNVVILKDKSQYGTSHSGVNISFMEAGLLEYVLGDGMLPDRYDIMVYDSVSGSFKSLNYSDVSTLDMVYEYFGIDTLESIIDKLADLKNYELTSDEAVLESYLNSIVNSIRNSNFLGTDFSSFSGSSTTSVPSQIPDCVKGYFNNVCKVLNNLSSLTDTVAAIDPNFRKVDTSLANSISRFKFIDNMVNDFGVAASNVVDSASNVVNDIGDFVEDIFGSSN